MNAMFTDANSFKQPLNEWLKYSNINHWVVIIMEDLSYEIAKDIKEKLY